MGSLGYRPDKTEKGYGYFGELKRPGGGISTELSIGVNFDGKEVLIPTIVPTLSRDEIDYLLNLSGGQKIPENIIRKAVEHAKMRLRSNLSPFAMTRNEIIRTPENIGTYE